MKSPEPSHVQSQGRVGVLSVKSFPVTVSVAGLCLLVFGLSAIWGLNRVFFWLHFPDIATLQGLQIWRWVSPAFIHFGMVHIVFNVLWWYLLGRIVEFKQGSARLLFLFFATAIVSNLAQFLTKGLGFGGLSGVVYGLFGYVWLFGHLRPQSGLFVPMGVMVQILAWLLLGFTGWLDQWVKMANAAHLMGLVIGLLLAVILGLGPVLLQKNNR